MDKHHLPFTVAALMALTLIVLDPLAAEAGGEVNGVSAPSSATKGTAVTITVTGKADPCQNVDLDFGDGTAHATYTGPLTPPKTFTHTYTTTGTKTITAKGVNNCKGQATASIVVKSYLATLCASTNCGGPVYAFIPPKINSVFIFSDITPGGFVVIVGEHFGTTKGRFFLKGLRKHTGQDFGDVDLSVIASDWKQTVVGGTIPSDITPVKDQAAKLTVRTATNQWSNEFPVNFRATREIKRIPAHDYAVVVRHCGSDSNFDACNYTRPDKEEPPSGSGTGPILATIQGVHRNCWGCIGTDRGTDVYELWLYNGWVFDTMEWYLHVSEPGQASASKPSFPSGGTHWKPQIPWEVTPNDSLWYTINVNAIGPKGVPWSQ
ncbi:MAG: hypothetical protein L0191_08160 [Acidobacteria bacterium]|nr:hypothetical protein [Acidobacteriota bacterium]